MPDISEIHTHVRKITSPPTLRPLGIGVDVEKLALQNQINNPEAIKECGPACWFLISSTTQQTLWKYSSSPVE